MKIRGVVAAAGLCVVAATGVTAVAQAGVSGKKVDARARMVAAAKTASAPKLWSGLPSPNGAYYARTSVSSAGNTYTRLYSRSGKELMSYTDPSGSSAITATPLAWSRDSRYLAVSASTSSTDVDNLAIIDTRTMTAKTIVNGHVGSASFAPAGVGEPADELVFDEYSGTSTTDSVNLYEMAATGGAVKQLTTNGQSAEPVWGRRGIFFDRVQLGTSAEPMPVYLSLLSGGKARQLTHAKIGTGAVGLVPIAVSANGNRLIANFVSEAGMYVTAVQLSPFRIKTVLPAKAVLTGFKTTAGGIGEAISRDGKKLLVWVWSGKKVDVGDMEWLPFGGGTPHKLTNGNSVASWNF